MNEDHIIIADESNFEYQVLAFSEKAPVLVDFWAQWSETCQRTSPLLEALARNNSGKFRLAKVDVDNNKQLTQRYQVHTVPTLKAFENGLVTHQIEGIKTNMQVIDFVKEIVPGPENLLIEKAASLLKTEEYKEVEETCLEILDEQPAHPMANLLLVKSLIWQGDYPEALTILNRFPSSSEFQKAEILLPLVKTLSAGLNEQDPSDDPLAPVYNRAINLIMIGNIPAALDGLLEILKQDKRYLKGLSRHLILGLFELLGDENLVTEDYRSQLANTLF